MNETQQLLRDYAENGSENAFRELVSRYIDLVYSAALRRVGGDVHRAEDIVQTVFTDLARKAHKLRPDTLLGGWLHRHCCFVASNIARAESRRAAREEEAAVMNALNSTPDSDWAQLSPVLDEAIQALPDSDRDALVLRFFEKQDLRSVGAALGTSEDAAQKRVARALGKLRQLLLARGVALPLLAIEAALTAGSVMAAPAGWTARVSGRALEAAAAGSGLTATLMSFFSTTGGKFAVAAAVLISAVAIWQWQVIAHFPHLINAALASAGDNARPARFAATTSAVPQKANTGPAEAVAPSASNVLRLTIVSAETGAPLEKVPLEYRARFETTHRLQNFTTDAKGVGRIPIPTEPIVHLAIYARKEGYSDTRLSWYPSRGQKIPESYTLKLPRATPISGTVVDANGNPVEGATVGFNHDEEAAVSTLVEAPLFVWVSAQTDSQGRWKIDHIDESMIRQIRGGARHPDHLRADYSRTVAEEALLRNGTHVFRLGAGLTVRGTVVEEGGTPIANAEVLVGSRDEVSSRIARTELDGSFEVKGCSPGPQLITASAPQYASKTIRSEVNANAKPVELVLVRGKVLKLRVVDRVGRPIPNASVWLNTMSHRADATAVVSQARFNPKTDADGRVVWDQAPDHELNFSISARGYMRGSDLTIPADGLEHTVVLNPALTVSGTVKDKETGEPIPSFKLITGWPEQRFDSDQVTPHWSGIDRFWLAFANGKFQTTFEETPVMGVADPSFMFKIEAEGYAPFISRVVKADEGSISFDVALCKALPLKIVVLRPEGQPAPETDLIFSGDMEMVLLAGRGFARHSGGTIQRTDASGQFTWQPDDHVRFVCAAGTAGFAETTVEALKRNPIIQLRGWGRIEGKFSKRGKPADGIQITVSRLEHKPGQAMVHHGDPVKADANGRFVIESAVPGEFRLGYLSPNHSGPERSFTSVHFKEINVKPGETTTVEYDERGVQVRVRAIWPHGVAKSPEMRFFASLQTPLPTPPKALIGQNEALRAWYESPELQIARRHARQYPLAEKEPNVWTSPEVAPGSYSLQIHGGEPGGLPEKPRLAITGEKELVLPEDWDQDVFDAGEIVLQAINAGSPVAP